MKLTIEKLAPYLPYGLKIFNTSNNAKEILSGIDTYIADNWKTPQYKDKTIVVYSSRDYSSMWSLSEIIPILRPLSDLTKEIEHNGEKFVPSEEIWRYGEYIVKSEDIEHLIEDPLTFDYWAVQKLFEWHFDVFGLIPEGLAIDINTLL